MRFGGRIHEYEASIGASTDFRGDAQHVAGTRASLRNSRALDSTSKDPLTNEEASQACSPRSS